jgi:leucyl/phenylalanyl-tRNA--protein transferase
MDLRNGLRGDTVTDCGDRVKGAFGMAGTDLDDAPPDGSDPQQPTPELLLWAYRHAIFPMADPDTGQIEWFSPDPRGIIPLQPPGNPEAFHVPRNLAREMRKKKFDIRSDTEFEQVMRACGTDRSWFNRSWINETIISAYCELHRRGHAHSVEAWLNGELVGGLYGVHIGGAFFGESMFSLPRKGGSNSSKVCLVHLVNWLRHRGFTLLDTQFWNEHLDQFGCVEASAEDYLVMLNEAVRKDVTWGDFRAC